MIPIKAIGMEKIAGLEYGKIAALWPSEVTQKAFDSTTMTTEEIKPSEPPTTAPSVVH